VASKQLHLSLSLNIFMRFKYMKHYKAGTGAKPETREAQTRSYQIRTDQINE
jgi:hypothetical protein